MAGKKQKQRELARQKRQQKKRWQTGLILGVVLLAAGWFAWTSRSESARDLTDGDLAGLPVAPVVGSRAPDFTLKDLQGQEVSLSDYRGRPITMMFFHTW